MDIQKELLRQIVDGDMKKADAAFNTLIQDKARTILDIKKVQITADIFNKSEK